jgi:hypothetical protein
MSGEMTPREHADVRDLLLAESERVQPPRARRALVSGVVAVALVAGVAGAVVINAVGAPGSGQIAASMTPEPTPSASPPLIPELCSRWTDSKIDNVSGGDAIAAAAQAAELQDTPALSLSANVVDAADGSGRFDVTARVCGDYLNKTELVAAATAVAKAIADSPSSSQVAVLTVAAWRPVGAEALGEDPNLAPVTTEFQLYDWSAAKESLVNAWR